MPRKGERMSDEQKALRSVARTQHWADLKKDGLYEARCLKHSLGAKRKWEKLQQVLKVMKLLKL